MACRNKLTITGEQKELKSLIDSEFKHIQNDRYIYNDNIQIIQEAFLGIRLILWTEINPDFEWLEELIVKYPTCWIKNSWKNINGAAGIWVGNIRNGSKLINNMEWLDISSSAERVLFLNQPVILIKKKNNYITKYD